MTTSVSNAEISATVSARPSGSVAVSSAKRVVFRIRHTLASRFLFLTICVAIVLSALAYGTVHYWAMALFDLGGVLVIFLWIADAWRLGSLRVSKNVLQLPVLGMVALGLFQLLPLRATDTAAVLPTAAVRTLS